MTGREASVIVVATRRYRGFFDSCSREIARFGLRLRGALCVGVAALSLTGADLAGASPFLAEWGTLGTGPGQFDVPSGIAVDATSKVYVADRNNHRIQKFTADGAFVLEWGTFGAGPSQFNSPRDVAVDAAGDVYVVDSNNDRIQKFTSAGAFLLQWGTTGDGPGQFLTPRAIAVGGGGVVYIAEDGFAQKRVQRFTSSGGYLGGWGSYGPGDGQFLAPRGVAIDDGGFVYVSDTTNHRIQKFTSSGAFVRAWGTPGSGPGQFSFPIGIRWLGTQLYVVDQQNHRIQVFDSDGVFSRAFGSRCEVPDGPGCVDPDGAGPLQPGDGQFDNPQGIAALANADLFVTDTGNARIEKFGTPPTGVGRQGSAPGIRFSLASANPTSGVSRLRLELPARADGRSEGYRVHARVFDVAGRLVRELPLGSLAPGEHVLAWDGATASGRATPGIYVLRLSVAGVADQQLKLVRLP
jgi:DNA-binding beta-propeller fold protein YncE